MKWAYQVSLSELAVALKFVAFVLFIVGFVVRFSGTHGDDEIYPTSDQNARRLLSLAICLYFMRGMEFFYVFSKLGPRLTTIYKMVC